MTLLSFVEEYDFPFIKDVAGYEKIIKIGHGTFGEVYKARCKKTGKLVALKKILMENEKEGFPITALREIRILQKAKHPNITELIEVCASKATSFNRGRSTFYMVFAFCEHDLAGLLSNPGVRFGLPEAKQIMKQLFEALWFIHRNQLLHRDMKSANILLTKAGVLKLADFGLARVLLKANVQNYCNGVEANSQQVPRYTNRVVTLWYRPPELLLGERNYTQAIDIWGAGCIMAELWLKAPLMQGDTEVRQLKLIIDLCGEINSHVWPGVENLELYKKLILEGSQNQSQSTRRPTRKLKDRLRPYVRDPYALELIDTLLMLDPGKRLDASEALNHNFFWMDPLPVSLEPLMRKFTSSMFEYLAPSRRPQQQLAGGPGNHQNHGHKASNSNNANNANNTGTTTTVNTNNNANPGQNSSTSTTTAAPSTSQAPQKHENHYQDYVF